MSSNGRLPWFPFYPSDWLCDNVVRSMNPLARAGYIDLLCYAARNHPIGTLKPCDNLQKLSGLSEAEFESEKESILAPFILVEGLLVQKRMYEDAQKQERKRLILSESGKIGMKKRWSTEETNKVVITTLLQNDNNQSQKQSQKKEKKASLSKDTLISKLQTLYPKVDVSAEFVDASAWMLTHPDRQFTQRFFTTWVKKAARNTSDQLLPISLNGNGHEPVNGSEARKPRRI